MKPITTHMPSPFRLTLYAAFLLSWCTGVAFFFMNGWVSVEGDFGPEKHPLQYPTLKVHGAAAFLMMMFYGSLLGSHVLVSWRTQRMRGLGLFMVFAVGFQVLTAWLLYYLSSEDARSWVAWGHFLMGVSLPLWLTVHIVVGRATNPKKVRAAAVVANATSS